jgi:ribosome biogenesis GTPase / thiamine phosphate phosphatase
VSLSTLGWNSFFQQQWNAQPRNRFVPARVVEEQRETYRVVAECGELSAEITGRLRHAATNRAAFPAVGDWVVIEPILDECKALIHDVLPRRSKLSRKEAGDRHRPGHERAVEQILVANVDTVLVVMSVAFGVNSRLVERYLGTVWESGAMPVLILSKADLSADPMGVAGEIAAAAPGVSIHVVSAVTGQGMDELAPYIGEKSTVVLVGSSGVGKSTIINRLLHEDVQATQAIRASDGRGRHTTTYRRLFVMPAGGVLIDTPGIRELHLWESGGLDGAFEEISAFATQCRFRDCQHQTEPGCAVQSAIANGDLEEERLTNYLQLKRELAFLDRRRDLAAQSQERKRWKQITKAMRRHPKYQ